MAGSNRLGVALAALMRVPSSRKVWLRAEALRRILVEYTENDYRRLLLQECVEAYLQLSEQEQQEFEQLLHTEPYKEIEPMMVTTFEKGVAKGLEEGQRMMVTTFEKGVAKGRAEGRAAMLLRVLEQRFRVPVPEELAARIRENTDLSLLEQWLDLVFAASSLDDFQQHIHGVGAR